MTTMAMPRTLPLRVDLDDGEALDSWLTRLAHRNGMRLRWLTATLGFGDRLRVWHNYALTWKLPPGLLRRIEAQTGLRVNTLDAAVLDQFDALGWKPVAGSRYCPACLRDSGGRWPIRWQLPYTFTCLTHRSLLAVLCPVCQRTPHSQISQQTGLAPPTRCTLGARHDLPCDGDLPTHPLHPLDPADPRLTAQAWINTRLDHLNPDAVIELRDLNALATWFRHRITPAELAHLGADTVAAMSAHRGDNHAIKRHPPTAALIAAAMTYQAIGVITADDHQRASRVTPLLRDVHTQYRTGQAPSDRGPMILSHKRLTSLSHRLQRQVLHSIDAHLPVTERLRYRTCTTTPSPPTEHAAATDRARHVPQYLWPDWIIRFLPGRGAHVTDVAIDIPNALLIPGNPARNVNATGELNPWRNNTSIFLSECTQQHPDTLAGICALANYLDVHGSPIDYRRRRAVFPDVALTPVQWHELCYQADSNPGGTRRLLNARRYLFQLLTGADLDNAQHPLAFTDSSHKYGFQRFHRDLNTPLRDALHRHGVGLLHAVGIDEPLTWSPPAACVAGLHLPGRDPDDIDLPTVRHLLDVEDLPATVAAHRLGVTAEHIRYAQQQFHRPPRPLPPTSRTVARQIRERAAALLTREFFEREYRQTRRTLRALATLTGIPHTLVAQHARAHGIRVSNRAEALPHNAPRPRRVTPKRKPRPPRPPIIDPDWLREQAGTLRRANTDIGAELGLSHETVRRHRKNLDLPARPTGSAGHTVQTRSHPDLPADVRRAVEGKRHGWQRLRRFQQLVQHPSVKAAADAFGLHHQNLQLQLDRLEADIGASLINRTTSRYQPITATPRGEHLLQQLKQPEIQQLLSRYAAATAAMAKASAGTNVDAAGVHARGAHQTPQRERVDENSDPGQHR